MSVVHVAVGVILDERQRVLISRRASDAHQGGLWEFPGGKVEPGESLEAALFDRDEIPWEDIAFRSGYIALTQYFAQLDAGTETVHLETATRLRPNGVV